MSNSEQYELASYMFKLASSFLLVLGAIYNSAIVIGLAYFVSVLSWLLSRFQISCLKRELAYAARDKDILQDGLQDIETLLKKEKS